MSSQVLALKYRPRRFEDLIGQDSISTTLSLALDSNRLSHAYLFSGLRGSGKTSTARIMAKALVCQNAPTSKPCEECDGCKAANDYRHMDIIEMDAASNRGIDDIKDLIEHTKYKPTSAHYKVFIIDEVHMLTTQAFNALLKTLEEPPAFVKFILATTDPLKLPATILSRTQHFRFKKISDKNILHHLTHILNLENISYENEALEILIRSGQGSLRDTLTLLDQAIIYSKGYVKTSAVTDMMGLIDPAFMDKMFNIILQNGDLNGILTELESYEVGQVLDEIAIYLKQKMLLKDLRFDVYMFDRFFRILGDAKQLLAMNSDGGFVLILTLAKLAEATHLKTLDDFIGEIEKIPAKTSTRNEKEIEPVVDIQEVQVPLIKENKVEENHVAEQIIETKEIPQEINPVPVNETSQSVMEAYQEPHVAIEQVIEPEPKLEQNEVDVTMIDDNNQDEEHLDMYAEVEGLIFDRSYELGECFANSFLFNSYKNNILTIDSCANDECRKILHKHFAYIRAYIEDIFGKDTEIQFNKLPSKELPQSTIENEIQEPQNDNSVGSMVEDQLQGGSGCVATMGATSTPTPAQQEMTINDVLNSKMVQKTIELFQPETQIRVKNKI
jgi:DNA polymerase-3 subunit gamma/tau